MESSHISWPLSLASKLFARISSFHRPTIRSTYSTEGREYERPWERVCGSHSQSSLWKILKRTLQLSLLITQHENIHARTHYEPRTTARLDVVKAKFSHNQRCARAQGLRSPSPTIAPAWNLLMLILFLSLKGINNCVWGIWRIGFTWGFQPSIVTWWTEIQYITIL